MLAIDHDERLPHPPTRPTGQHVHTLAGREGGRDILVEPFQERQDRPVDAGVQNLRVDQRMLVAHGEPDAGVLGIQQVDAPVAQSASLVTGDPDAGLAHRTEQHRGDVLTVTTDRVAARADHRLDVHRRPD
ncbi:MAG: hypothetical protein ACT4NY_25455 [Pseudonocardiales bacterium]